MLFPALMPSALDEYLHEENFDALYTKLLKNPSHLILFFETAADDETWSEKNPEAITKMIEWLQTQSLQRGIPHPFVVRAAEALRKHQHILETFLPFDITIVLSNGEVSISSLLLCANSSYFRERVERECRDRDANKLLLTNVHESRFQPFMDYFRKGELPNLPTASENEVLDILRHAKEWKIEPIIVEAQKCLRKYVTRDQALSYLQQSLKERWPLVSQVTIDILNVNENGYSFYLVGDHALGFQLQVYSEAATEILETLHSWITSLTCGDGTVDDVGVLSITKKLDRLTHIDLSRTSTFPVYLDRLPKTIEEFTLVECPWVNREMIQKIAGWYPGMSTLSLANNTHILSSFWSVLIFCKELKNLDISGCYQIGDMEFSIALKSLQLLQVLNIGRCSNITDMGFAELSRRGRRLVTLSLTRTKIRDRALVELALGCLTLADLNLSYCREISEKGILELVKNSRELQHLNLEHTEVSRGFLEKIRGIKPLLTILN